MIQRGLSTSGGFRARVPLGMLQRLYADMGISLHVGSSTGHAPDAAAVRAEFARRGLHIQIEPDIAVITARTDGTPEHADYFVRQFAHVAVQMRTVAWQVDPPSGERVLVETVVEGGIWRAHPVPVGPPVTWLARLPDRGATVGLIHRAQNGGRVPGRFARYAIKYPIIGGETADQPKPGWSIIPLSIPAWRGIAGWVLDRVEEAVILCPWLFSLTNAWDLRILTPEAALGIITPAQRQGFLRSVWRQLVLADNDGWLKMVYLIAGYATREVERAHHAGEPVEAMFGIPLQPGPADLVFRHEIPAALHTPGIVYSPPDQPTNVTGPNTPKPVPVIDFGRIALTEHPAPEANQDLPWPGSVAQGIVFSPAADRIGAVMALPVKIRNPHPDHSGSGEPLGPDPREPTPSRPRSPGAALGTDIASCLLAVLAAGGEAFPGGLGRHPLLIHARDRAHTRPEAWRIAEETCEALVLCLPGDAAHDALREVRRILLDFLGDERALASSAGGSGLLLNAEFRAFDRTLLVYGGRAAAMNAPLESWQEGLVDVLVRGGARTPTAIRTHADLRCPDDPEAGLRYWLQISRAVGRRLAVAGRPAAARGQAKGPDVSKVLTQVSKVLTQLREVLPEKVAETCLHAALAAYVNCREELQTRSGVPGVSPSGDTLYDGLASRLLPPGDQRLLN